MSNSRRKAREIALQGIYSWLVNGGEGGAIEAHLWEHHHKSKPDKEHFDSLFYGVIRHHAELDETIRPTLDRDLKTLSPVEHALLLMGCYELLHHPEIPIPIIINEAVELAKSFGGVDGFKYVNGVLDRLASPLRAAPILASTNDTTPL